MIREIQTTWRMLLEWLEAIDPGTHRRIKGLRLVTAYGIAALLGALEDVTHGLHAGTSLSSLAGGFALWASVSEARATRAGSSRDLVLLVLAAVLGSTTFILLSPVLSLAGSAWPELVLVTGAFLVGYLRRFGIIGTGVGSQIYIGQLLAYGAGLKLHDYRMVLVAGLIAGAAAVIPRLLSGPAERPVVPPEIQRTDGTGTAPSPAVAMGLQAGIAAFVIVGCNAALHLDESAWAITACTYVVAGTAMGTIDRIRRRIVGTIVGVPLALAALPLAETTPVFAWGTAALAMVIYAIALPERYDIACGAYAFTLIMTLAVGGDHSVFMLASRAWETLLGGALGLAAATVILPLGHLRRRGAATHPGKG